MQLSGAAQVMQFWTFCQRSLFPEVEEGLGALSEKHKLLASAIAMLELGGGPAPRKGRGRPRSDEQALLRSFLAKMCFNLETNQGLIERLQCDEPLRWLVGWPTQKSIPSASVFSRGFAALAASGRLEQLQVRLVESVFQGRLVGHVIRDASAIPVREKPARKPKAPPKPKRRRGRPRKGDPPRPKTRLERQPAMSLAEMLADLPTACDRGTKTGTDGRKQRWKGYKLHWDVSDSEIPLSCVVTSASTHDSQVAIPLACKTAQRVTACYELMDAGYQGEQIRTYGEQLGHVVLIPEVDRKNKPALPMAPAQKQRYRMRTLIERMTGRLKDEFGGGRIRVRGHRKVLAHLMLGILMLAVDQVLRLAH